MSAPASSLLVIPRRHADRIRVVVCLLALSACGHDTGIAPTPGGPPPVSETALTVLRGGGVAGSPASGVQRGTAGRAVTYSFSAEPGFERLAVYLDSIAVPAAGEVRMDRAHLLVATALPIVEGPLTTPIAIAARDLYSSGSVYSFMDLADAAIAAADAGDSAALGQVRRAEYAALRDAGPAGLDRLSEGLAGESVVIAGASPSDWNTAGLRRPAGRPEPNDGAPPLRVLPSLIDLETSAASTAADTGLFTTDTVVPTTYIFVNGILNSQGDAVASALEVLFMIRSAGFPRAAFRPDAYAPRPNASVRVIAHWNPILRVSDPSLTCLRDARWALTTARLGSPAGSMTERAAQAMELLRTVPSFHVTCGWTLSTNFRVLAQLVEAKLGAISLPNADDWALVDLIAAERGSAGGRNVVVLGHSQGSVIARTAIAASAAPEEARACLGAIAVGSPLSTSLTWPNAERVDRLIAKGAEPGSQDFFYAFPFGAGGRTDGRPSGMTRDLDNAIRNGGLLMIWPLFDQFRLHEMVSYLNDNGAKADLMQIARESYSGLSSICAGRLSGTVTDLATGVPIAGATVQPVLAGAKRGMPVPTGATGTFLTSRIAPIAHDLVISAPGYDSLRLPQRLVPFRATAAAQQGVIPLGKSCTLSSDGCPMQGVYRVAYNLSGASNGIPLSCAFISEVTITQRGSTFDGTIRTSSYQRGCETPTAYIKWEQGETALSEGVVRGRDITYTHAAIPDWHFIGVAYANGFRATEPAWRPGGDFNLRVEMVATRIGSASRTHGSSPRRLVAPAPGPQLVDRR